MKQRKEKSKPPQENLEELEEHRSSEKPLSSSSLGKTRDDPRINTEQPERKRSGHERLRRPPLPKISGEVFLSTESDDWEANHRHRTRNWEKQSRHQDQLSPKASQKAGLHCQEAVYRSNHGQGEHRERKHRPRAPPISESEARHQLHDAGNKGQPRWKFWYHVYTHKQLYLISIVNNLSFLSGLCSWLGNKSWSQILQEGIHLISNLCLLREYTHPLQHSSSSRLQWRYPSQIQFLICRDHISEILIPKQCS